MRTPCVICGPLKIAFMTVLSIVGASMIVAAGEIVASRTPQHPSFFDLLPLAGVFGAGLLYAIAILICLEAGARRLVSDAMRAW